MKSLYFIIINNDLVFFFLSFEDDHWLKPIKMSTEVESNELHLLALL